MIELFTHFAKLNGHKSSSSDDIMIWGERIEFIAYGDVF